eukprot:14566902-Alexandrium_andersonii.AAC.1
MRTRPQHGGQQPALGRDRREHHRGVRPARRPGGRRRQAGSTRTRPQHKELQPALGRDRREQQRGV